MTPGAEKTVVERTPPGPGAIQVVPSRREEDALAWNDYVDAHPGGTVFHRTPWQELVHEEFGFTSRCLKAIDGEGIRGVLPLFEVPQPIRRRCLVSVPFAVYGGVLADRPEVTRALVARAGEILEEIGGLHLELRHRERRGLDDLPGTDLYVTYVRDLPPEPEACLALLPRKARAAARQARDRYGLEAVATRDLIDAFHPLFLHNKRRLGSPSFAPSFFRRALETHRDRAGLFTVLEGGRPVSAVIYFTYRDTIFPYFSGTGPGAESVHANNFMYMALMEHAVRRGFTRFDFGRSRRGTGSARFKEHQGFTATDLDYRYVLNRADAVPCNNPSNPRFDSIKRIWARTPAWVTRLLGPRLIRYFP